MEPKRPIVSPADLRGLSKLGVAAAVGVTNLVEQMHHTILRTPLPIGAPIEGPARGITGFVYSCVRGVTHAVGAGLDLTLSLFDSSARAASSPKRDMALAALNGVVGDHLADTANPLALEMTLRRDGRPLPLDRAGLADALPAATGRVLVLVHGLCMSDLQWTWNGHDHGAALARDHGFTPVYLFYNTGRHISENGRQFAELLETLTANWPVPIEDFAILGHSMGGLVSRSALHYGAEAGHDWPRRLRKLVSLGTPHNGAPLERIGSWIDVAIGKIPYTAAFNRLGRIRSAGVTDLRYGLLLDEDWRGRDRFSRTGDTRTSVPLPAGVACFAVAATTAAETGGLRDRVVGDGLVQVASALGLAEGRAEALDIPDKRRAIVGATNHLDLMSSPAVYEKLAHWLGQAG